MAQTLANTKFTFVTEDGFERMTHAVYEKKVKLRKLFGRQSTHPPGRRVVHFGFNIFSYSEAFLKEKHAIRKDVEEMERMYKQNPLRYFVPAEQTVVDFLNFTGRNTLKVLHAGVGSGKAQPLSTIIPTPYGDKRFGSLEIGDEVFAGDGSVCRVTGVFDRGVRPVYRVWFDKKEASTLACGEHLWKYMSRVNAYNKNGKTKKPRPGFGEWQVLSTEDIIAIQGNEFIRNNSGAGAMEGFIPASGPAEYPRQALPLHPYVLGAMLGDGCFRHAQITSDDPEIPLRMEQRLPEGCKLNKLKNKFAWSIVGTKKKMVRCVGGNLIPHAVNPFREIIAELGLDGTRSHTKFIPEKYMIGSIQQRLDLLHGLMDTDGCVPKASPASASFTSCSKRMASQLCRLVESLGGKCRMSGRVTHCQTGAVGYAYHVKVIMPVCPFHLTRKKNIWRKSKYTFDRILCNIIPEGDAHCMCITVDSVDHTYQTNHHIVTHNSVGGVVDWLLDIVPTEPDWCIFQLGVKRREQKTFAEGGVAVVSYQLKNLRNTLWPQVICRWCPLEYTQPYMTGKKNVCWGDNPKVEIAGTVIYFFVSSQKESVFTGQALDIVHWDEQHGESRFKNADDRVSRRDGRHVMTMTPHKLKDQPETGAGTWVDKIRLKQMTTSLDVRFFQMNKLKVLDWVVTKEEKAKAVEEHIDGPLRRHDKRALAEGRSKVFGEFHEASGLVLDNFEPDVHIIQPFDVPTWWTWYRFHDHGRKEPNACLLVAVDENDTPFVMKEFYKKDIEIKDAAAGIIAMSGNTVKEEFGRKVEQMTGRLVRYTRSDPRSLSKSLDNSARTIQDEYHLNGLSMMHGTGERPINLVPLLTALLQVDESQKHFETGALGAPSMYISSDCVETLKEATSWRMKTRRVAGAAGFRTEETPEAKNDHAMTCLLLLASDKPLWVPSRRKKYSEDEEPEPEDPVCSQTGY